MRLAVEKRHSRIRYLILFFVDGLFLKTRLKPGFYFFYLVYVVNYFTFVEQLRL